MATKVAIACDHAGFPLKETLSDYIKSLGYDVIDLGTNSEAAVDYPDYALKLSNAIVEGTAEVGVLLCGSGVGASVAANKVVGIRAGVCHDTFSAHQCREDDDVNVLCMGARVIGPNLAKEITKAFLDARFSKLERHQRRLDKVLQIEKQNLASKRS